MTGEGSEDDDTDESAMIRIHEGTEETTIYGNNMVGSGEGTAILDEGRLTNVSSDISRFDRGIVKRGEGSIGIRDSTITDVDFAYTGHPGSIAVIDRSKLDADVADVVLNEDAQLVIYNTVATCIMEITRGTPHTVDPAEIDTGEGGGHPIDEPELYHIARAVLLASDPESKREHSDELLTATHHMWDRLFEGIETIEEVELRIRLLIYVWWLARALMA